MPDVACRCVNLLRKLATFGLNQEATMRTKRFEGHDQGPYHKLLVVELFEETQMFFGL